jgi:hypothetical protein
MLRYEAMNLVVSEDVIKDLENLRFLESRLGYLHPDSWKEWKGEEEGLEDQTDNLFTSICKRLETIGFAPAVIAKTVNDALGTDKYCNEQDVVDVLS